MTQPSFTQLTFRGRYDNGSESGATWKATQGTDWTQVTGVNFRVRFRIDETASRAWTNKTWNLYYSTNDVDYSAVSGSTPVQFSLSSNFAQGDDCTTQLTGGTGTFLTDNNGMCESAGSLNSGSAGYLFEVEYSLKIDGTQVSNGNTIYLKVYDGTSAIAGYTDYPAITVAKYTLTVQDSSSTSQTDTFAITQKKTLVVQDSSCISQTDNVILISPSSVKVTWAELQYPPTASIVLVVGDSSCTSQTDTVTLTQKHSLSVADSFSTSQTDNVILVQKHTISVADSFSTCQTDSIAITQASLLIVSDSFSTSQVDNVILTQKQNISVNDNFSTSQLDTIVLVQKHTLIVNDSFSTSQSDSIVLTQKNLLIVQDSSGVSFSENVVLSQKNLLTVQDSFSTSQTDNTVLTQKHTITVADSFSVSQVDQLNLTQKHLLVVADSFSTSFSDNIILGQANSLVVNDLFSTTQADNIVLVQKYVLSVADTFSTSQTDNILLTQKHTLVVQDSSSISFAEVGKVGTKLFEIIHPDATENEYSGGSGPSYFEANTSASLAYHTAYGMAVTINNANTGYFYVDTDYVSKALSQTGLLRYRFYLDPNGVTLSDRVGIVRTRTNGGVNTTEIFLVNDGGYKVEVRAFNDSGGYTSILSSVISDAPHCIEVYLTKATGESTNDGTISLYIDGQLVDSNSSIDNYTRFANFYRFDHGFFDWSGTGSGIYYYDETYVNDSGSEIGTIPYVEPVDSYSICTVDSIVLVQKHTLIVADSYSTSQTDNVILTQKYSVSVQDSSSTSQTDNVVLTQKHLLVVQDSFSTTQSDLISLSGSITLTVFDAFSTTQTDNITLTQKQLITVQDSSSTTQTDNIILVNNISISVQDSFSTSQTDSINLVQDHYLITADSFSTSQVDNVVLITTYFIIVSDSFSTSQTDSILLTQKHSLSIADSFSLSQTDSIILTIDYTLSLLDSYCISQVDSILLTGKVRFKPFGDITDGNWTNQDGSAENLYDSVNETVYSDVDYIQSEWTPVSSEVVLKFESIVDPYSSSGHILRYRYGKHPSGSESVNFVVQLRQDYVDEGSPGTLIAEWTHNNISSTLATAEQTLTSEQADSITDYSNLFIRMVAG